MEVLMNSSSCIAPFLTLLPIDTFHFDRIDSLER
jgi:hypothetical protein